MSGATDDERFHDPWWLPKTAGAKAALEVALQLTEDAANRHRLRQRKENDRVRFARLVTAFVCDLWHREAIALGRTIIVSRAKRNLDALKGRYDHPELTGASVAVQDALVASGLCKLVAGQWGGSNGAEGRRSTLRATPRLLRLFSDVEPTDFVRDPTEEVILLRAEKDDLTNYGRAKEKAGNLLNYADDADTERMRRDLRTINDHLAHADIELDDGALEEFTERRFDPSSRRLYRIFANASFESGGRLYRGFWIGLPSASRHDVMQIDGEAISILDYGQMSARLAYAKVGATPPDGDLYAVHGLGAWQRDGVKKLINAALFSASPLTRRPKGTAKLLPKDHMSVLMGALRRAHAPIAPLFENGEGLRIQRLESDIMVEVLIRLIGSGITALPIHDAVIVARPNRMQAEATMKDVFREKSGVDASVS